MILDTDALPLARSWWLFEVLQTFNLLHENTAGNFEGLHSVRTEESSVAMLANPMTLPAMTLRLHYQWLTSLQSRMQ